MKEDAHGRAETQTDRRTVLRAGTAAFTAAAVGTAATGLGQASTRETYAIREGTADETEVVVIDGEASGPTAVVVGGMHGNETSGHRAAQEMREWSIDAGKLVLIPRSNPTAIESGTYSNDNGNLNRKFPPGEEPTTPLARAIWGEIIDHDADLVLNLHSSKGIYQEDVGPSGYGQAIYPTTANGASQHATAAAEHMNENHVDDSQPDYLRFKRGNLITGDRPLLTHKVDADLQKPGFIVEVTRYDTNLETRVDWTLQIVEYLLSQYSIERGSTRSPDDSSDGDEDESDDRGSDDGTGSDGDDGTESDDDDETGSDDSDESTGGFGQLERLLEENEDTMWAQFARLFIGYAG